MINTRWLGLKSDPSSRVTLFDCRVILLASLSTDPLFSLQSPSGARHKKKTNKKKTTTTTKKTVCVQAASLSGQLGETIVN